ncbi:MAG: response regulator [Chloroflexi bacterium]|nr:response regulator [Chloroflexota bacterium]
MSTVLVIERDPATASIMQELLEDEGHTVMVCQEAALGFDAVHRGGIDLVVLELWTPTPSFARQCICRMRGDQRTATIPILVCTVDERQLRQWADWLDHRRVHMLVKPFDIDAFVHAVNSALR